MKKDTSKQRLFVAATVANDSLDKLAALQQTLQSQIISARFVPRENLHLTLRFIGDFPVAGQPALQAALQSLAKNERNPEGSHICRGRRLSLFGAKRDILVLNLDVASWLVDFQNKVETALVKLGVTAETRPWRPHLTLARQVRSRHTHHANSHWLQQLEPLTDLSLVLTGFTLFSSTFTNSGVTHTPCLTHRWLSLPEQPGQAAK